MSQIPFPLMTITSAWQRNVHGTILIEGCDCTGKTTLARKIEARFHMKYVHYGPPEQGEDLDMEYRRRIGENAVIDRAWLSELIYGKFVRGRSRLSFGQVEALNLDLLYGGGTLIVCHSPDEIVSSKWAEATRGEYVTAQETVVRVNQAYLTLYHLLAGPRVFLYDYTEDPTADGILAKVEAIP